MLIDLEKFSKAELKTSPFDYVVVENFIKSSQTIELSQSFPEINSGGSFPLNTLEYGDVFAQFIDDLKGKEFRQCVEKKFDVDLKESPIMITARGMCKKHNGKIHIDSKGKILTFLIYFNESWDTRSGNLRLLRGEHDMEDYFEEIPPLFGTLVAFKCSENAWHGHHPFEGVRRSIQLNYVQNDSYLSREQKRHKISAFFKKLKSIFS